MNYAAICKILTKEDKTPPIKNDEKKIPNKENEPTYVAKQNFSNLKISIGPGKISKK